MKIIIKKLLDFFDYFTQAKILGILKNQLELEKPIILIDVGAHKGEYIFSISKNFLIKKIYAFEPNFDIYKILEKILIKLKIYQYSIMVFLIKMEMCLFIEILSHHLHQLIT